MEYGAIETSIYIDAAPNVVYGVVSSPEHITQWYVDEAAYDVMPGSSGHLSFGDQERWFSVPITVVEAVRGTRFSFRWIAPPAPGLLPVGATLTSDNSLLVTFEFTPRGDGTLLTVTETGMRELAKPPVLAGRGGCWFAAGSAVLHLGVEEDFRPAGKAHPGIRVTAIHDLAKALGGSGVPVVWDYDLPGHERFSCQDPVGNRLEFLEPLPVRPLGDR